MLTVDNCQGRVRCVLRLIWTKATSIKRCCALRLCLILATCSFFIGGFLLLRLLLLMSGDVESNPGPIGKALGINDFLSSQVPMKESMYGMSECVKSSAK